MLTPTVTDCEIPALVRAALDGDAAALQRLAGRFDRQLRWTAWSCGLGCWDADDVVQTTWLQFLQHGRTLREPAAVSGWLMTTARRQSLRMIQGRLREQPAGDAALPERAAETDPHDELLSAERHAALRRALDELPPRSRRLMTLLVAKPDMTYEQVGQELGMPIGSIGPTRLRAIARLRRSSSMRALYAEA